MNQFAVRVRIEHFHRDIPCKMCGKLYKHISFAFIIDPAVNNQIRNKAYRIIDRINHACFNQIAVIITVNKRERHVPDCPQYAENNTCCEQIKFSSDTMSAISTPAKFFDDRNNYK